MLFAESRPFRICLLLIGLFSICSTALASPQDAAAKRIARRAVTTTIVHTKTKTVSVTVAKTTITKTAPAGTCTPATIVANGGFESGSIAPWTDVMDNPGLDFQVVPSSSIPGGAHSGNYSAAFASNGTPNFLPGAPADAYQSITNPYNSSTRFIFKVYVKTPENTCDFNVYGDSSGVPFLSQSIGPAASWIPLTALVTPGSSFNLVLEVACSIDAPFYIDDVSLTPA